MTLIWQHQILNYNCSSYYYTYQTKCNEFDNDTIDNIHSDHSEVVEFIVIEELILIEIMILIEKYW